MCGFGINKTKAESSKQAYLKRKQHMVRGGVELFPSFRCVGTWD